MYINSHQPSIRYPKVQLPELDICQESSPARQAIVIVQLLNVFGCQLASSCDKIGGFRIPPLSP